MNMVQVVILGFDLGTIEILQNYELNCSIAPKIQKPFLKKNLFVFSLILVMTNKFFALSWHLSLFLILFLLYYSGTDFVSNSKSFSREKSLFWEKFCHSLGLSCNYRS